MRLLSVVQKQDSRTAKHRRSQLQAARMKESADSVRNADQHRKPGSNPGTLTNFANSGVESRNAMTSPSRAIEVHATKESRARLKGLGATDQFLSACHGSDTVQPGWRPACLQNPFPRPRPAKKAPECFVSKALRIAASLPCSRRELLAIRHHAGGGTKSR